MVLVVFSYMHAYHKYTVAHRCDSLKQVVVLRFYSKTSFLKLRIKKNILYLLDNVYHVGKSVETRRQKSHVDEKKKNEMTRHFI